MKSVEKLIKKLTKLNEDGKINEEQKTLLIDLLNGDEEEVEKETETEIETESKEVEDDDKTEVEVEVEEEKKETETETEEEILPPTEEMPNEEQVIEKEEETQVDYATRNDFEELIKTLDEQTKRIEVLEDIVKELGVEKEKAIGLQGEATKEPITKISRASMINARRIGKLY